MAQTKVDYSQNPSGQELLDDYLGKEQENILTTNSGVQRPVYAKAGTIWLDLSATPWKLKAFDGNSDIVLGYINATTHAFTAAGDGNFVHKTGEEKINGTKTFIQNVKLKSILRLISDNITKGTNPDSTVYKSLVVWNDKNDSDTWKNSRLGLVEFYLDSEGTTNLVFGVYKNEVNSAATSFIIVKYKQDGTKSVIIPTPPSDSNDDSAATTRWIRANVSATKHIVVSTLPAVIDPDAFYYIPE